MALWGIFPYLVQRSWFLGNFSFWLQFIFLHAVIFITLGYLCGGGHVLATAQEWRSEDVLRESAFTFHRVNSGQAWWQTLYLLSHL